MSRAHDEAAARYPFREAFGAPGRPTVQDYGRAFGLAQRRAEALGLVRVLEREGDEDVAKDEPAGLLLPGLSDDDPPVPPIARWLGAVTLYYRPRSARIGKE